MKQQSGFTLIELIMVIVILGILAATAMPKFIDLKSESEAAAIKGVAGAVSSAFATNYAGYMINTAKGVTVSGSIGVIAAGNNVMQGGSMPAGYTLTLTALSANCTAAGQAFAISVSNSSFGTANQTAPATLICTG